MSCSSRRPTGKTVGWERFLPRHVVPPFGNFPMLFGIETLGQAAENVQPPDGWHCSHYFYRLRHLALADATTEQREKLRSELPALFDPTQPGFPQRCQLGVVSGHKADLSLMMMDPDPLRLESLHRQWLNSEWGPFLETAWSYVSLSEISEYVQSPEQYAERLVRGGENPEDSAFQVKVRRYAERLEQMNVQRLTPEFPDWPVSCFYPMNKWRHVGANWYSLPASERHRLMLEHARSGIRFAGKVTQLITVGIGLDDWEWGVTLWASNPIHLKQIVYDMRFDEASARYAEFGPFYTSYLGNPSRIADWCLGTPS